MISGCTLAILANVLDFRTYSVPNQTEDRTATKAQQHLWKKFDRNNIPGDERMAIIYARGVALSVFEWIREWCIVKDANGKVVDDLPSTYMVNLLDALLAYKSRANRQELEGAPHCAAWMLEAQVSNVVKCDSSVEKLWKQRKGKPSLNLTMTLDKGCTVEWRHEKPLGSLKSGELFLLILYCQLHYFKTEFMSNLA